MFAGSYGLKMYVISFGEAFLMIHNVTYFYFFEKIVINIREILEYRCNCIRILVTHFCVLFRGF